MIDACEMPANYTASLSLPILQSRPLHLSNRTVVNSFTLPRPPCLHWPTQSALPSPSGGPRQPLFAQWTKLGCSLLSEHCLHFSAIGSSLQLTAQPDILLVPSLPASEDSTISQGSLVCFYYPCGPTFSSSTP